MRTAFVIWLLLGAGLFGCTPTPQDDHSESIPEIPPGRGAAGAEADDHLPMAPTAE
jgi:hypothetical protein